MTKPYCGMVLKTKTPTSEIVSWLKSNCTGQWDLHPTGLEIDGETKKFMVLFDNESDLAVFEDRFGLSRAAA